MDFLGNWRVRNGMLAEVTTQEGLRFYGVIHFDKYDRRYDIPASWDENGNCIAGDEFDLVDRKREGEGL